MCAAAACVQEWVSQLGYKDMVAFTASDAAGNTVYHTNVMMAIGTGKWSKIALLNARRGCGSWRSC